MKIWTIQDKEILEMLSSKGLAYCNLNAEDERMCYYECEESFKYGYDWLVGKMKTKIGNPPEADVTYPLWAWATKSEMRDNLNSDNLDGKLLFCLDIPEDQVVLTDFYRWDCVIHGMPACYDAQFCPVYDEWLDSDSGGVMPEGFQEKIESTWDAVFNLDLMDESSPDSREKKVIQATFWAIRKEWVVSVKKLRTSPLARLDKFLRKLEQKIFDKFGKRIFLMLPISLFRYFPNPYLLGGSRKLLAKSKKI